MRNSVLWLLWAVMGCAKKPEATAAAGTEKPPMWPFPSAHLIEDGRISLPALFVPRSLDGAPIPLERLEWRTGFSVVQSSVIDLDSEVDSATLPGQSEALSDGSVQLWDLTDGLPVRCFAETDAYPDMAGELPVVIVRPLDLLVAGHRIAVVITEDVRTPAGDPVPAPAWYQDLMTGRPGPGMAEWTEHYSDLNDDLQDLGVADVVFAFDFPVADGGASVRTVVAGVRTPTAFAFDEVRDVDEGYIMPEGSWRQLVGSFTNDSWLADDTHLRVIDNVPQREGTIEAQLFVHMPESIRTAEAGTVPVWLFGHGIFGDPQEYMLDLDDGSTVVELADEAGAILVGTVWRGLENDDRIHALGIARDFGRLPEITDRLHQGIADVTALSRLVLDGDLLDAPEFEGKADRSQLMYYGISLGGIAGAVMLANNDRIAHGVLHVGGAAWSSMLERSSQWMPFDWGMSDAVPSARDRQLLYALSQLYWDPVDPANHTAGLIGRSVLWQESIGDEQVANFTTELIGRAVGARLLAPSVTEVAGMPAVDAPLTGPAIAQFDPEVGMPPEENRPSPMSQAHSTPRTWPGTRQQVARFLNADDPGVVAHFCGDDPCTERNPGVD